MVKIKIYKPNSYGTAAIYDNEKSRGVSGIYAETPEALAKELSKIPGELEIMAKEAEFEGKKGPWNHEIAVIRKNMILTDTKNYNI